MTILEASKKHLPQILRLYAEVLDKGEVLSITDAEKLFDKMADYPNYKIYVAEIDNQVVGTFALLIMDNLAHIGTPSGIIEDVVVDTDFQGQGIGKSMMNFALNKGRQFGCYKMVLSSNLKRIEAHQFYENLGFEKHGFSYKINL
ncbi:acetyltransferase (GNAT) family protein [Arcicella aurantiaca]|uniref:Acetyltransferase (GNAT) family protein n=1 Tax=Arcicella aurantiaca TaxID=591202 RepID=A0A316E6N1_9BACT|nr:GNAT family N-acetyltransferase [Arcicella aurantiaca]PWK25202.1 acetyltransferase (GNAT) family protein [Arcicella aurantiaca]